MIELNVNGERLEKEEDTDFTIRVDNDLVLYPTEDNSVILESEGTGDTIELDNVTVEHILVALNTCKNMGWV